jgi:hypothetical protein
MGGPASRHFPLNYHKYNPPLLYLVDNLMGFLLSQNPDVVFKTLAGIGFHRNFFMSPKHYFRSFYVPGRVSMRGGQDNQLIDNHQITI